MLKQYAQSSRATAADSDSRRARGGKLDKVGSKKLYRALRRIARYVPLLPILWVIRESTKGKKVEDAGSKGPVSSAFFFGLKEEINKCG